MKKFSVIAVLAALLCMVSGCDFIRSIAGRPTSDRLAAASDTTEVAVEPEGCCSDTTEAAAEPEKCCPDTTEVVAEPAECCSDSTVAACAQEETCAADKPEVSAEAEVPELEGEESDLDLDVDPAPASAPVVEPKPLKSISMVQITRKSLGQKAALDYKYYVLIGTFAKKENLDRQVAKARKAGLDVEKITFSNGLVAVGVCPTDNFATAVSSLETLKKLDFCPKDAHIIVAE